MTARHVARLCVAKDHPALAGHFPGEPVVPGVVLLDLLLGAAERQLGRSLRVAGIPHVKFPSPLRPEEAARASFEIDRERLRFEVSCDARLVARGELRLAAGAGA